MAANGLIPPVGKKVRLADYSTRQTNGQDKESALVELTNLQARIDELQNLFHADRRYALLIILQAIDAGGKDGTIRSVYTRVDPLGMRAVAFRAPSTEELSHDYLWRIHSKLPEKGETAIFNRSHYEDVLVVRVKNLVPRDVWQRRYDHINAFERMLTDEGTVILKFFLHISKEEQRERLQERVDNPAKQWKFRRDDLQDREMWDEYQRAFEAMIERCNTAYAPWHIIPGDRNWYRDLLVARTIVAKLEDLGLRYPPPQEGITGIKVV
jgi:PPK2 family polyphosphate:nucleotide phosphotransferase